MIPSLKQLTNAALLIGAQSALGYAYGRLGNLPAKEVALAWAIWEIADIAFQHFINAYGKGTNLIEHKVIVLSISDIVGLAALIGAGLTGSTFMTTTLVLCTLSLRALTALTAYLSCPCCNPGPRFTMDLSTKYT